MIYTKNVSLIYICNFLQIKKLEILQNAGPNLNNFLVCYGERNFEEFSFES